MILRPWNNLGYDTKGYPKGWCVYSVQVKTKSLGQT